LNRKDVSHDPTRMVAVVGMASRLPGAPDYNALWRLLSGKYDAITSVPADRWDTDTQLDVGRRIQAVGGFLDGVADFDPTFFGISPREAADIDPQQRLLLEATWQALEDAGQMAARLRRTRCGVYVGASWHDYEIVRKDRSADATQHSAVGNALDILAARISYFLALTGPSLTVETGCSSALVALHLAAQALRQGEIDSAIVGGVNLILAPDVSIGLTHFGGLSEQGRCRAFATGADGFVRGEGVVALHLKRLDAALADGDRVHGVIVGTAVNNDGGGDSLVAPNPAGQEDLLRTAYAHADVPADRLVYIEAHGTGTPRGDPIEAGAIGRVLGTARDAQSGPLPIGSIKTNVGHLEAAAGLAGLVKVLLALRHREIPASLYAEEPNPDILFEELNLRLVSTPIALDGDDPVYLGVNSFGWGGTNAHAIVMSPPIGPQPTTAEMVPATLTAVSAHSEAALRQRARELAEALDSGEVTMPDLALTLARRRDHFATRAAFVATDPATLSGHLHTLATSVDDIAEYADIVTGHARRVGRTAFVFPGQGAQWTDMGRALYTHMPVFSAVIDRCAEAIRPFIDWDLAAVVAGQAGAEWLDRVDMVQPVLWSTSVGLAELWRSAGVEPDVVIGHSQGEVAAATVSGALSYEDAARVVARRSTIVRSIVGQGLMLAVELDPERIRQALEGFEELVSLAVNNGPTSCVLSGDAEAVLVLKELLDTDGVHCRLVKVDYASHSPQMDGLVDELNRELAPVRPREGVIPMMSTVRVALLDGEELDAAYWVANLRHPVRFAEAVTALLADGVTHVVEVSMHPILTVALEELASVRGDGTVILSTLCRDQGTPTDLGRAFARAYVSGLEPLTHLPVPAVTALPAYPWQRARYWAPEARRRTAPFSTDIVLTPLTVEQDAWQGELDFDLRDHPWLDDHRVHNAVVFPGTGMLALALNAARARTGVLPRALSDVHFRDNVTFTADSVRLAALWRDDIAEGGSFTLLSLSQSGTQWNAHATARIHHNGVAADQDVMVPFPVGLQHATPTSPEDFYDLCARRGLNYGPAFRVVRELRCDGDAALGRVGLDERGRVVARPFGLHPTLWDGALQVALALCGDDDSTVVPTGVERVVLHQNLAESVTSGWSHVVRRDTHLFDLAIFDNGRRPLLTMSGLRLRPLRNISTALVETERLYHMSFLERPRTAASDTAPRTWAVVGATAHGIDDVAVALRETGATVHRVPFASDLTRVVADTVVYVAPTAADGLDLQRAGLAELTRTVRACAARGVAPRLAVITYDAQAADPADVPDPGAALFWGFTRVLRREHGELEPRIVDLKAADPGAAAAAELLAADGEDQVLLRAGRRLVGRLTAGADDNGLLAPVWATRNRPYRLTSDRPGLWEGLTYRALVPKLPGPGEVLVKVTAAALNFIDVMKALGTYPDPSGGDMFGGECAGRVMAVGEGVTAVRVGERVVACVFGAVASHVTLRADHVRSIPSHLEDVEAATLPLVMMTAWYGLHDLARLETGETVLIHSAAGGLGQAAINVARSIGARIIATAGSADKRQMLHASGIVDVFDSRDLSWVDGVRAATGGRGVDVVLNSLSGVAIGLGLDALAEDGRFVEVGKKDIYQGRSLDLRAFRKGLTFAAVDLAGLMQRRPERFAHLFDEVWSRVCEREFSPLPYTARPFRDSAEALRGLGRGGHVGKFVLIDPLSVTSVAPEAMPDGRFRADGCYLITGGLGALGLSLAEFLAENGAGELALVGRSRPSAEAAARIDNLRRLGTRVTMFVSDIVDSAAVNKLLIELRETGAPLRGVAHAAGVLDDATISTLSPEAIERVISPKVDGARHLDAFTRDDPLDFFLLFSSAAALFGNTGQSAYAAGNAFLDALATARRHSGLPALSVQWGPFAGVGLAAADANRGDRLTERGMGGFTIEQAWKALPDLLARDTPVVGYVPLHLRRWFESYPETVAQPSWELLRGRAGSESVIAAGDDAFLTHVLAVGTAERSVLVEEKVRELAGRVLRLAPLAIDGRTPFKELGLDSLLSLELRNRLEVVFGLRLSATLLWTYGTTTALATVLNERLDPTNSHTDAQTCDLGSDRDNARG
jgi:phthiocerol/phenolphthiocerol synthesis type-I polyketide synthase C